MSATKDAASGAVSGAMPWLILVGAAVVAFWWLKNKATGAAGQPGIGFTEEQLTSPMFGNCSTGIKWLLNWNNCRSAQGTTPMPGPVDGGMFYPSPNPTPTPGNLMDAIAKAYHESVLAGTAPPTTSLPLVVDGIQSAPGPAVNPAPLLEPPAPVDNYVIGSAADALANADAIKAAADAALRVEHPLGLISSYNQVRQYDTNRFITPHGQPADFKIGDRYLDISPYGWVVYGLSTAYLGDPPEGKYHNLYGQGGSFGGLTHELPGWL